MMNDYSGWVELESRLGKRKKPKINPDCQFDLGHGWLIPYLMYLDLLTWKRWDYWAKTLEAGKLLDEDIPQIEFGTGRGSGFEGESGVTRRHLEECLDLIPNYGGGGWLGWSSWEFFNYFLRWLLYGFGFPGQPELPKEPPGCKGASSRLYQYFELGYLILHPWDYWGAILAENRYGRTLGFYPTPMPVVNLMARITFSEQLSKTQNVYEPCLGTGRMLLYASNYSLCLYGQDINGTVIDAALVNGYCYAPWMVQPIPFIGGDMIQGNTLANEGESVLFKNEAMIWDKTSLKRAESLVDETATNQDIQSAVDNQQDELELDIPNQWRYEPIKKLKRKGKASTFSNSDNSHDEPEAYQGCLF
jgi:hypothetical protein